MYKPAPRVMLYEEVLSQILNLIKEGKWVPGEKIPNEKELSKHFEVSRNSIREALKVLEHLKIISSKAGSGTFLLETSTQNIQNLELIDTFREESTYETLMETRIIIEPELAYRAALRATPEELTHIEKIIEDSRHAIEEGNYFTSTVGYSFHQEIAKISRNGILSKFLESITLELLTLRKLTMKYHKQEDLFKEIKDHKKIFDLIKDRKADEAKQAMFEHLKNAEFHLKESK